MTMPRYPKNNGRKRRAIGDKDDPAAVCDGLTYPFESPPFTV